MYLLFCADPLNTRHHDPAYEREVSAVDGLQIPFGLVDFEALINENDPQRAVRRIPDQCKEVTAVFRGWMLRPAQYQQLYDALFARGLRLINDPVAYQHCHYLPDSYPVIETRTPKSVWLQMDANFSIDRVAELLGPFGDKPIIVKDFVKSQKHHWKEACYIPSAADRQRVEKVVRRFLELQGNTLNEGLVFREFIEFEPLVQHNKSGMPLTKEYRIFFLDGNPIDCIQYWEEGDYQSEQPPVKDFYSIARQVKSRFFTMDIAKQTNGQWTIVELGDGQVAGLPDKIDAHRFFKLLNERLLDSTRQAESIT